MMNEQIIKQLKDVFEEIVTNMRSGKLWKNIPLAKRAFEMLVTTLKDDFEGELTPKGRVALLQKMMDFCDPYSMPRFALRVREYQLEMLDREDDAKLRREVESQRTKLEDYLVMDMKAWCEKYDHEPLFDPVEQSLQWEEVIYDVEKECEEKTRFLRRGMGFCFEYWQIKRQILARRSIAWRSPHLINPQVCFD